MSRHALVEGIVLTEMPTYERVDWSTFAKDATDDFEIGIRPFLRRHEQILMLAGASSTIRPELLSGYMQQLFLGHMAATETYFRDLLLSGGEFCEETRSRLSSIEVPYGALDYYADELRAYAISEKVSYSSQDAVSDLLFKRLKIEKVQGSVLDLALAEYGKVCQVRHSLVHSSGTMSRKAAASVGHVGSRHAVVELDLNRLMAAVGVCRDLVLIVNDEVAKTLVWRLIQQERLTGHKRRDAKLIDRLTERFAQEERCSTDELFDSCKAVVTSMRRRRA